MVSKIFIYIMLKLCILWKVNICRIQITSKNFSHLAFFFSKEHMTESKSNEISTESGSNVSSEDLPFFYNLLPVYNFPVYLNLLHWRKDCKSVLFRLWRIKLKRLYLTDFSLPVYFHKNTLLLFYTLLFRPVYVI